MTARSYPVHNVWTTEDDSLAYLVRSRMEYDTNEAAPDTLQIVTGICAGTEPVPVGDDPLHVPDVWRMGVTPSFVNKETREIVPMGANKGDNEEDDLVVVPTHCEVIWVGQRLAVNLHPGLEGKVTAHVYGLGEKHNQDIAGTYVFDAPDEDNANVRVLDADVHDSDEHTMPAEVKSTHMTPAKEAFARLLAPVVTMCMDPRLILRSWQECDGSSGGGVVMDPAKTVILSKEQAEAWKTQSHGEGNDAAIAELPADEEMM